MGTGKTSVGRLLADRLGMRFVDMDDVIEQRADKPITRIFSEDGEPHFRALERSLVRELSAESCIIIGTGGGVVLNPDNIRDFGASGLVVCLSARPETILDRLSSDTTRPLLAGPDKLKQITQVLESRRELYASIPFQVDTTALSAQEVTDLIAAAYEEHNGDCSSGNL